MRMFLAGVETISRNGQPRRRPAFSRSGVTGWAAIELRPDQFICVAQGINGAPSGTVDLGGSPIARLSVLSTARRNTIANRLGITRTDLETLTVGQLLLLYDRGIWQPDRDGKVRIQLADVVLYEADAVRGGAVEITEPFTYSNGRLSTVSSGAWDDESANMNVASNAVVYATNSTDQHAAHNTELSTATHYAQVVSTLSTTGEYAGGGVIVRGNGAVGATCDGYRCEYSIVNEGIGTRFQVYVVRIDNDVTTDVASTTNIASPDTSAHTIRVEANGSTLTTFIDTVSRNVYGSASSYTTNKFVGMYAGKYNGGNVTLDSFEAGTLGVAATDVNPVGSISSPVSAAAGVAGQTDVAPRASISSPVSASAAVNAQTDVAPNGTVSNPVSAAASITSTVPISPVGSVSSPVSATAAITAQADVTPNGSISSPVSATAGVTAQTDVAPTGSVSATVSATANITATVTTDVNPVGSVSSPVSATAAVTATASITPGASTSTTTSATAAIAATAGITPNGSVSTTVSAAVNIGSADQIEPVSTVSTTVSATAAVTAQTDVTGTGSVSSPVSATANISAQTDVAATGTVTAGVSATADIEGTVTITATGTISTSVSATATLTATAEIIPVGSVVVSVSGRVGGRQPTLAYVYTVPPEPRTLIVAPEPRTLIVAAEHRMLEV